MNTCNCKDPMCTMEEEQLGRLKRKHKTASNNSHAIGGSHDCCSLRLTPTVSKSICSKKNTWLNSGFSLTRMANVMTRCVRMFVQHRHRHQAVAVGVCAARGAHPPSHSRVYLYVFLAQHRSPRGIIITVLTCLFSCLPVIVSLIFVGGCRMRDIHNFVQPSFMEKIP